MLEHFKTTKKDLRDKLEAAQSFKKDGLKDEFKAAVKEFKANWTPPAS